MFINQLMKTQSYFINNKKSYSIINKKLLSTLSSSTSSTSNQILPKSRVLSGIQPTGSLHLGNYLGAIKQWIPLQDDYDCHFTVVDLHAFTIPENIKNLKQETINAAAIYLACGINVEKSNIFIQSHVKAHTELMYLLSCITPLSWAEHMIQYKEKASKNPTQAGVGLLTYPILMAADILLYTPEYVPVGDDQKQHLELTRNISRKINSVYGKNYYENYIKNNNNYTKEQQLLLKKSNEILYPVPKPMILSENSRVCSLTDGKKKMSKSDENEGSRINLLDSPDTIIKKIKRAKSDAYPNMSLLGLKDNEERPEALNLIQIYKACLKDNEYINEDEFNKKLESMNWSTFKKELADVIIEHLKPIQSSYYDYQKNPEYLEKILKNGEEKASIIADNNLLKFKNAIGFCQRF